MFNLKQLIVFTLVILVWGGGSRCSIAQDSEKAHVFKSRPNGAIVQLIGSYTIIGQTPLFISHDLNGMYQIKVTKPGYESWKKQMMFYSGLENEFDIQLPPRTRWKAGWRSLLIPGWGQFYSERRIKGSFVASTFGLTLGVTLVTLFNYQNKLADYQQTLADLNDFRLSNDDYQRLWQEALAQNRNTDKAYHLRKKWLWITGSLYIANLIDALVLFPSFHRQGLDGKKISISMKYEPGATQFCTSVKF